jgi:hypothetical protein
MFTVWPAGVGVGVGVDVGDGVGVGVGVDATCPPPPLPPPQAARQMANADTVASLVNGQVMAGLLRNRLTQACGFRPG